MGKSILNNTLKSIVKIIYVSITVVLILTFGSVLYSKLSGGSPSLLGYELKYVLSGSMEPVIQTGSIIAITPSSEPHLLRKGEVITFHGDNRLITHRIIDIITTESGKTMYQTKGDNNNTADQQLVDPSSIVGVFSGFHLPYAGYILDFANSKSGTVAFLFIPGLLLFLYGIFTLWKAISKLDNPQTQAYEQHTLDQP